MQRSYAELHLGRYCFVGAGAVVTKDVPDYGLILGTQESYPAL